MNKKKCFNSSIIQFFFSSLITHHNPPLARVVIAGTAAPEGEVLGLCSDVLEAESCQDKRGLEKSFQKCLLKFHKLFPVNEVPTFSSCFPIETLLGLLPEPIF
jgi:hypothetical protein